MIAIFNPGRHWHQMAWAIVSNDDEAKELGKANGFFSWKLEKESEYSGSAFCRDVEQLSSE